MTWRVEVREEAAEVIASLPRDIRSSFERIVHLIESHGLERSISKARCGRCV